MGVFVLRPSFLILAYSTNLLYMTLIIKAQSVAIDYRFYSIRNLHMCIVSLLMQYCRKKSRLISVLYELKCSSILRFIYL